MPQHPHFPENLTGREVVRLLRDLRRDAVPEDDELFEAFGLAAELDKPVRTLSGGTRQKLNAAVAFMFRPGPAGAGRAHRRPRPGGERRAQGQDPPLPRAPGSR